MPDFPTFNNAVVTQYPYGEDKSRFIVTQSYVPAGFAQTTVWNPNQPLARFVVHFDVMTAPERQLLETFWKLMGGSVGTFTFTDDAGNVHTDCQFESETLEFTYLSAAHCAVEVSIVAFN